MIISNLSREKDVDIKDSIQFCIVDAELCVGIMTDIKGVFNNKHLSS